MINLSSLNFSKFSDRYNYNGIDNIYLFQEKSVFMGDGNDSIIGNIYNENQYYDVILSNQFFTAIGYYGINIGGFLNTGKGDDSIYGINSLVTATPFQTGGNFIAASVGVAVIKDQNTGSIPVLDMGDGSDVIRGIATGSVALIQTGLIIRSNSALFSGTETIVKMGAGNDYLLGSSTNYSSQYGAGIAIGPDTTVSLGKGDDVVIGSYSGQSNLNPANSANTINYGSFGICAVADGLNNINYANGKILAEDGNDQIYANSENGYGLGNNIFIDLGNGNDYIQGFGNCTIIGGSGSDTLDLSQYGGISSPDWSITVLDTKSGHILLSDGFVTADITGIERFVFNDATVSFNQLVSILPPDFAMLV